MSEDFTRYPVGHVLPDGRIISKCPVCGRSGLVLEMSTFVSVQHHEIESWTTASGELRGNAPRRNTTCFRRKNLEAG